MRNILITGGAGFIGSHLCERLLMWPENNVYCIDNLYSGSLNNIRPFLCNKRFHFREGDVCDAALMQELVNLKLDEIYHCACPASPIFYQGAHAIDTTLTCVNGTYNVLALATKCGAKMMQFSTSEVYGEPRVPHQSELDYGYVNPVGVRSCYDEGKRAAESLCMDFVRTYNTKVKIIRIFNTYGPRMRTDDGRIVSNFICQTLRGEPMTIYGKGTQTRSFCYIDDLIDGILIVMRYSPGTFTGPINLGNPQEITIKNLGIKINQLIRGRKDPLFEFLALPQDDPTHRCPDITQARKLGFEPKTSLQNGLKETIKYFKKIIKE